MADRLFDGSQTLLGGGELRKIKMEADNRAAPVKAAYPHFYCKTLSPTVTFNRIAHLT